MRVCGDGVSGICHLISNIRARTLLKKGCSAFLAYVIDVKQSGPSIPDIPVVCDFADVFPDEFPGIVPDREIEFAIELVPGANPISIAPYRMASAELLELKMQLKQYLDKGVYKT